MRSKKLVLLYNILVELDEVGFIYSWTLAFELCIFEEIFMRKFFLLNLTAKISTFFFNFNNLLIIIPPPLPLSLHPSSSSTNHAWVMLLYLSERDWAILSSHRLEHSSLHPTRVLCHIQVKCTEKIHRYINGWKIDILLDEDLHDDVIVWKVELFNSDCILL